ncbi:hypothetical protein [Inquilinus sp. CAU 1745]|uniref:hypothetical protein n=1 Tax=Inquilinus sp. CAU 1745 TaxID=3140369 RepID=UPI00325BE4CE
MAIVNVDGIRYLDSGVVFLRPDGVVEVSFLHGSETHVVALKLRADGGAPGVRHGAPTSGRTVVHLANMPMDKVSAGGRVGIGKIGDENLRLAFELEPLPIPDHQRKLTFMLFVDAS